MKNLRITIEGPEGAGKSEAAQLIRQTIVIHNRDKCHIAIIEGDEFLAKIPGAKNMIDPIIIRTIQKYREPYTKLMPEVNLEMENAELKEQLELGTELLRYIIDAFPEGKAKKAMQDWNKISKSLIK